MKNKSVDAGPSLRGRLLPNDGCGFYQRPDALAIAVREFGGRCVGVLLAMLWLLPSLLGTALPVPASAGELERADIERRIQPPLHVGEKATDVPAWPISSELEPEAGPIGWIFESIDLAPIPGFEGTPYNLLISLDREGNFMDVEVLRQHEPVFLSGLGEAPLKAFVAQYAGHNLRQDMTVSTAYGDRSAKGSEMRVVLDGVTKATASVRILNQTVLTAALAVARARLGFAAPASSGPPATVREDLYEPMDFRQLLASGAIGRLTIDNAQLEAGFAGGPGAALDPAALARPDETFIELYVAYLNPPTIGRALLGDEGYRHMRAFLEPGQHAWWVASAGRGSFLDPDFVRGTSPSRLGLGQDGAPHELRDFDLDPRAPPGAPALNASLVLRTAPLDTLDAASPQAFELFVTRSRGQIFAEHITASFKLEYTPPARFFSRPPAPLPEWLQAWQARRIELAIIVVALLLLSVVLAKPRWISISPTRLKRFRFGFLLFTLCYLGWYAQGQLSVVQLTGAVKTLAAGQGLGSFLYDPVSLLVIAFTGLTFVVWGRGTFCGWLCPFGALQEFAAPLGRRLGLKPQRLPARLARMLDRSRYLLLAALLLGAAIAPRAVERMVEVEPFKTAITVGFDRSWPYLAYALVLLALSAVYYKFFCRYVCPLGAAMTLGGKLRLPDWLPRRAECGKPCQSCRHRCQYDAIERSGEIRYDDCFQCLDCVGIYHDPGRCAPVMLELKRLRRRREATGMSGANAQ